MINLIIITVLLIISAISKAIQDKLQFHFKKSVFRKAKPLTWWNAELSWENKYKWFPNSKILTWLFSNPLVALTDAWHFFGLLRDFSIFICISVISENWWILLGYPIYRGVFHIFFTWILMSRK